MAEDEAGYLRIAVGAVGDGLTQLLFILFLYVARPFQAVSGLSGRTHNIKRGRYLCARQERARKHVPRAGQYPLARQKRPGTGVPSARSGILPR